MLESWENSAHNLIAHFRAVCRGQKPLDTDWGKADQEAAELDDHSLEFIADLKRLCESRGKTARFKSQARANSSCQLKNFATSRMPLPVLR